MRVMKIKITTENITGLSKEILSLLATYDIDIQRVEVETGLMHLATQELDKSIEREIATRLMQIKGVKWVESIALMPVNERNLFLNTILNAISDPVFGINNKGKIIYQNKQAQDSFVAGQKLVLIKDVFVEPNWASKIDVAAKNTLPININTIAGAMLVEVHGISQSNQKAIGAVLIFHKPENIATRSHIIQSVDMKGFDALVASDKQMKEIINRGKHLCNPHVPLVISGEAGVGKRTIAKAIHFASERKNKLFSSINCSTSKHAQMMEDLFGLAHPRHGKAGMLEIADGGTVYIHGVQDLSKACQVKLLNFIQTGEFNREGGKRIRKSSVKLIVSSPQPLNSYIETKQTLDELFYALDVTQLSIPPLRDRKADIEPFITHFLTEFTEQGGKEVQELSFAALNKLKSYYWPGNITQLKDILYKSCLLADGKTIEAEHIEIQGHVPIQSSLEDCNLPQAVAEFEKHFLQHWYQKYPSTRKLAAQLGVSHTTIAQKLNKYNVA